MKTEFGILVAQGWSDPRDGGQLLFQEIVLDSEKMLKLTDPAEMIEAVEVGNRVMVEVLDEKRKMTILRSDEDRIRANDCMYGDDSDPMLDFGCPF